MERNKRAKEEGRGIEKKDVWQSLNDTLAKGPKPKKLGRKGILPI
ncbi:hypothetical protein [uncultured Maribacter sp.]|nr:hypothetical protein [uncultured Maribacter sp.]